MSSADPATISRRIVIFLVVLDLLYILNCLAPYLGLKFENSQAMYSQLDARAHNHLVLSALARAGDDDYVRDVELEVPPQLEGQIAGLRWFLRAANQSHRLLHLQFLDHHFARLCAFDPSASVELRYTTRGGAVVRHDDVCSEPDLRDPFPIGLYPACDPECYGELEVWASGRWRDSAAREPAP